MKNCLDCGANKSRKGLYCKPCGYKNRVRPAGLKYNIIKSNPTWFKCGGAPWNKGLEGSYLPHWKGDDVSKDALHDWVERHLGKPSKCEFCGTEAATKYEWSNISGSYFRDLGDWQRLCVKCHARYDWEQFGCREVFYA